MDPDGLLTSPRKKLKARHDSRSDMAEVPVSSMEQGLPSTTAMGSEHRHDKEVSCGIIEYVSPRLPGFEGIFKKRYTDFLVNEILPNGKVIHLDNVKRPSDQQQLSKVASKPQPQQTQSSVRAVQYLGKPHLAEEYIPPHFESTNLNKVEQASRKKETVYMQHGADTLSLVNGPEIREPNASTPKPVTEDHETKTVQNETEPRIEVTIGDVEERILIEIDETRDEASQEINTPEDNASEIPQLSNPTQPGITSNTGSWQTYAQSNTSGPSFTLSDNDRDSLVSFFDNEIADSILNLFQRILASPRRKARDFGTITTKPIERDVRTEIHQAIRRIFSSKLETTTDDSGAMVIAAANSAGSRGSKSHTGHDSRRNDRNSKLQQPKGKLGWAQLGGDYLHFTIYKENRDTMEAISHLARILKLRPQLFQFAGTKDRRGITVQRASVYRVQANRLYDAGRTLRQSKIGNFEYHPHGLQLGDLMGNEFTITLRDCRFDLDKSSDMETRLQQASSILGTVVENFSSHGFINYFGLQRFGSFSTGTHAIGRSMLQGDFKSACKAILSFQPSALAAAQQRSDQHDHGISRDDMSRALALHTFATTSDSKQALDILPRKFSAEACLIRHLSRSDHHNDYLGALQSISRNLRLMYIHAYQSLVWNIAATARWKAHGDKVLTGDLVLINEHADPSTKPHIHTSKLDQDGETIITADDTDRAYTSDEIFTRARAVTESELAFPECTISISDVVLPLPGYDILYPASNTADVYKEFMASEEGGGLDPYDMRRKWKDVSLSGSYRKLVARPLESVEWSIRAYGASGEDEQFVETDLEKLERMEGKGGKEVESKEADKSAPAPHDPATTEEETRSKDDSLATDNKTEQASPTLQKSDPEDQATKGTDASSNTTELSSEARNDKIAVILKMKLGSSTYATMALRELMKEGGVKTWKVDYSGGR